MISRSKPSGKPGQAHRPVRIAGFTHIGKEANRIDEVTAGLVQADEGYAVFEDTWELARRVLAHGGVSVETAMVLTNRARSATMDLRAGRARSSQAHRGEMISRIGEWCRESLKLGGSDAEAIAAWLGSAHA